ncbi:MAG: DrmB family protein [Thermoleophilia bacterium]
MSTRSRAARVGELRPSALVHTFGVGAVVDLPRLSVMVMGLDEWRLDGHAVTIDEPRLVRTLRAEPGLEHLQRLVAPPIVAETGPPSRSALDASRRVGVPVAVFPRWLVCPVCRRLAPIEGGQFDLRTNPFRPERSEFVHRTCQPARGRRPPTALPARFVVACEDGHMDDFPWVAYVHGTAHADEVACAWSLRLEERDPTGEIAGIYVRCEQCEKAKAMAAAFGEAGRQALPACSGGHPHLRVRGECEWRMRAMLLGASNSWFAVTRSALSVPQHADPLLERVAARWDTLRSVTSAEVLAAFCAIGQLGDLAGEDDDDLLAAIERQRAGEVGSEPGDLRVREWELLTASDRPESPDFRARDTEVPSAYTDSIARVVLVERLREVQALVGFTRVDPPGEEDGQVGWTSLGRDAATWLPAAEVHGEGIFVQLQEDRVAEWIERAGERAAALAEVHRRWCARRGVETGASPFPGLRAVLVHTLSHALMRRLTLESGYAQAAIRERLYAVGPEHEGGPMAGFLLYTAAPGAEGTLGGLVALGSVRSLGRLMDGALRDAGLCDSDPLCGESLSTDEGLTLNGAACYACLFAPETSCERGNRYLDRAVLVDVPGVTPLGFFAGRKR